MKGIIFDIKEFTVHDGPGVRITVFLKGCPLRCQWCHNPEGLLSKPELMIKHNLCVHCGKCTAGCNHEACKPFDRCLFACPNGLIEVAGEVVEGKALANELLKHKDLLNANGGGITISGGEPLMQPDFLLELLRNLKGIHRAIQTCGYAQEDDFMKVINHVDYVMYDLKIADNELHKEYTGVSNNLILRNFENLKACGKPFVIRIPLIPGITDTKENLMQISDITGESPVELLPYNSLAGSKYGMVGRSYDLRLAKGNVIDISMFKNGRIL